jgi:hypothetical protein
MRDTITHSLDQHWFLVFTGGISSGLGGRIHGHDIVPVDTDCFDAVAHASRCNAIALVLFQRRRRDRVPVVPADKNDRTVFRGRDIEGSVEITLRGCALAEIAYDDVGRVFEFEGVGGAHGVRDLGG